MLMHSNLKSFLAIHWHNNSAYNMQANALSRVIFASSYDSRGTGISKYQRQLIDFASAYSQSIGHGWKFGVITPFNRSIRPHQLPQPADFLRSPLPGRVQKYLNKLIPLEGFVDSLADYGLIHSLDPQEINTKLPWVVTVHDVAWRRFGSEYQHVFNRSMQKSAELAIKNANHLVAISRFTADELIADGTPSSKISVIYQGVDIDDDINGQSLVAPSVAHLLPPRYALYIGTDHPRKNLDVILRAYSMANSHLLPPCVMVGPLSRPSVINFLKGNENIRHLGYLSDSELSRVIRGSCALIFPSLYEGFGRPIIEAMALGVPVVASRIPAFTEIAQESAFYFDIRDHQTAAEQLREALFTLGLNSNLVSEMVREGVKCASRYSWANAFAQLSELYGRFM